jgi:hypothetical protein
VNTPGIYADVQWYKAWIQAFVGIDDAEASTTTDSALLTDSNSEEHPEKNSNSGSSGTSTTSATDKIKQFGFANKLTVISAVILLTYIFN